MTARDDPMPFYIFQDGYYSLYHGKAAKYPTLITWQVAIVYDNEHLIMLKHGAPDRCAAWMKEADSKLTATGLFAEFGYMMITLPNGFPVEDINRVLSTSGYLRVLFEKWGMT